MKRILLILLLLACVTVAHSEQRVALVIGNGAYQDAEMMAPPNDARAMTQALREYDFEVIEKIDSDRQTMVEAIREFGKKIQGGGMGLFYYAGYGMQVKGVNYLIPVKAEVRAEDEVKDKSVEVAMVLGEMETAGNRFNIVILAACRNNPFARFFSSADQGLKITDAPKGGILAYAATPGEVVADGFGMNGLYTSRLLHYMKTPGLSAEQVFNEVSSDVMKLTGSIQKPWVSISSGDFYFESAPLEKVVEMPVPEKQIAPVYPENARRANITGWVLANVLINEEGKVRKVDIIRGPEVFHEAVKAAALQWEFKPAILNDRPVGVWFSLPFNFRLN